MKATTEHLEYLDRLRESGDTNMYGAGPYLREVFGLTRMASHEVLAEWMRTFESRKKARPAGQES